MKCTDVNCKHYRKPKKKDIHKHKFKNGYILFSGIPVPECGGCSKPYCMKRGGK